VLVEKRIKKFSSFFIFIPNYKRFWSKIPKNLLDTASFGLPHPYGTGKRKKKRIEISNFQ